MQKTDLWWSMAGNTRVHPSQCGVLRTGKTLRFLPTLFFLLGPGAAREGHHPRQESRPTRNLHHQSLITLNLLSALEAAILVPLWTLNNAVSGG